MTPLLTDTHCHIHSADYPLPVSEVEIAAAQAGVGRMVCIGTDLHDSELAVEFTQSRANCWAAIGVHPNSQEVTAEILDRLHQLAAQQTVVAVGECGLDYFYEHQPRAIQQVSLRAQIELALQHDLPLVFHVRDAFDDFWPIFDEYARQAMPNKQLRGVLHSFTDTQANADKGLERGLYFGINGIMTFTKNDWQLDIAKRLPLDKILLETDAPYLTPRPHRGKVNTPAHLGFVADFLAVLRGDSVANLTEVTTLNARQFFSF